MEPNQGVPRWLAGLASAFLIAGPFGAFGCHGTVAGSGDTSADGPVGDPGTEPGDAPGGDGDDAPAPGDGETPAPGDDSPAPEGGDVDEFDGSQLDAAWSVLRPELVDIAVGDGELSITPNQYSVWFNDEAGSLIHKNVTGNFKATTLVRARRASNPSEPVGPWYQFGGLLALDPTTRLHNYVFIVVGDRGEYLAVETKSTRDSDSDVQGPAWPSGDAELRLCRLGSQFLLYKRAVGERAWTEAVRYARPDLPNTLQVGPLAYAYTSRPDLRASFAWVSIAPAADEGDCTAPD